MAKVARQMVEDAGLNVQELLDKLGGELPRDIRQFADLAGCPDAYLPDSLAGGKTPTGDSLQDLLTVLVEAERCAGRTLTDICKFTVGKDPRTHDLSLAILNEEV